MNLLLVNIELRLERELGCYIKRVEQLWQKIIQLAIEFFIFIHSVSIVNISDATQEVNELSKVQIVQLFFVSLSVNDSHQRFCEDNSKHRIRDVKLALLCEGHTLFQSHCLFLSMSKEVESIIETFLVTVKKFGHSRVGNELLPELVSFHELRIGHDGFVQERSQGLTERRIIA